MVVIFLRNQENGKRVLWLKYISIVYMYISIFVSIKHFCMFFTNTKMLNTVFNV